MNTIKHVFENSTIWVSISCGGKKCIEFKETEDGGYYLTNLTKCCYSGTEILNKMTQLALLNNMKYLILIDFSSIEVFGTYIDFALLNILTYSRSWYNRNGFFTDKSDEEKMNFDQIRSSNFKYLFDKVQEVTSYSDYLRMHNEFYSNIFEIYQGTEDELNESDFLTAFKNTKDLISENFSHYFPKHNIETVTVGEICQIIYINFNSKTIYSEDDFMFYYGIISYFGLVIFYERYNLVKLI